MPYIPPSFDFSAVPKWDAVHPDLHKRWISTKPDKLRGHQWDFGTGAYVPYGSQFETADQLLEAALKLGLTRAHVNTSLMRIMIGDLMLAYLPKTEAERRVKELRQAEIDRDRSALDAAEANETRGVKTRVYESEEEYLDVRKHATRESNNRVGYTGRGR